MGRWFTNLFAKATELSRLDNEVAQLRIDLGQEIANRKLLESALEKERNKHNLALRRTADMLCRQNKLPEHFVKDIEPSEPRKADPVESFVKNDNITHYAKELRDADIEKGMNVASLEEYIDAIAADPDSVFISGT